uniref:glycerol-3-phosphate dehydrogenase n=1 Tax=Macrostomum lignano TaxID=282301 RepID=A0A1I8FJN6_9PLAT
TGLSTPPETSSAAAEVGVADRKISDNVDVDDMARANARAKADELLLSLDASSSSSATPLVQSSPLSLPPPPPKEPPNREVQEKVNKLLQMKRQGVGISMMNRITNNKKYRNPCMYEKFIIYQGIDDKGTNFNPSVFDPYIWDKHSYYDALLQAQVEAESKRAGTGDRQSGSAAAAAAAAASAIDADGFQAAAAAAGDAASVAAAMLARRSSKWDSGGGGGGSAPTGAAGAAANPSSSTAVRSRAFRRLCYLAAGGGALAVATLQGVPWALEAYNLRRNYLMDAKLPTRQEQLDSLSTEEFDVLIIVGAPRAAAARWTQSVAALPRPHWLRNLTSPAAPPAAAQNCDSWRGAVPAERPVFKALVRLELSSTAVVEVPASQYASSCWDFSLLRGHPSQLLGQLLPDPQSFLSCGSSLLGQPPDPQLRPHLSYPLPIMLPIYHLWQLPYFWAGIKMYDLVSGTQILKPSFYLSNFLSLSRILKSQCRLTRDRLQPSGQHEDARMCLSIGLTAAKLGPIQPPTKEVVSGARVLDRDYWQRVRYQSQKENPQKAKIVAPSAGIHITLPRLLQSERMGLLDPATADGRTIRTPTEDDVKFILKEIKHYLSPDIDIRRGDVLSAWAGIRPLVTDAEQVGHAEHRQESHHRSVGQQNGDHCGRQWRQSAKPKVRARLKVPAGLACAYHWGPNLFIRLVQEYGVEPSVAQHLANIIKLESLSGQRWPVVGKRLHRTIPTWESEVRWATREYACRAVDILARRTRLAFANVHAAVEALPPSGADHGRGAGLVRNEASGRAGALQTVSPERLQHPINLSSEEIADLMSKFRKMDADNKGFITLNDLERYFKGTNHSMEAAQIMDMIDEVDLNRNGRIEMSEFLQ